VAAHADAARAYPGLCEAASAFAALDEAAGRGIMACVSDIYAHDVVSRTGRSQWHIARRSADLTRLASHAIATASASMPNDEVFRTLVHLREDTLPELERHLEAILYNHMLGPA
jgi:hypothetical protein